jgi:L-asparaginase II
VLVRVIRDHVVESVHRGHLVIVDEAGRVVAALGDPEREIYARSAVKPFQTLGSLDLLDHAGLALDTDGVAIACASHSGSTLHQVEVARLLALAGLDERALQCPAALPWDLDTLLDQRIPTSLAHNCSGKHAGFLLATRAARADPAAYLREDTPVQRAVHARLAEATTTEPRGPGVDGCGAPAWILPLRGLAAAFARLAAGGAAYARVRDAMLRRPHLIGGQGRTDTTLMLDDHRVVAKAGAEAVLAVGFHSGRHGALGLATKIEDGSGRATGPVVATALRALGGRVGDALIRPLVLGGGEPHGVVEPSPAIIARIRSAFGDETAATKQQRRNERADHE